MLEVSNADRAICALSALERYINLTGSDTASSAISDLIGDLLHLGYGRGFNPSQLMKRAHGMMLEECLEDVEGNMNSVQRLFRALLEED